MRQSAYGVRAHDTAVIEDFLELGGCFRIAAPGHKSLAPHIGRVETTQIQIALRPFRPIRTEERFAIARCYDGSDILHEGYVTSMPYDETPDASQSSVDDAALIFCLRPVLQSVP